MAVTTSYDRYARQIILKGFGEEAQLKLSYAHVLVIGAGGLGCPVLQYLVAAGIGTITIVDDDKVALHNIHRQVLYDESNIGEWKVEVAMQKLSIMNCEVEVNAIPKRLNQQLAMELFPSASIVVDAPDNFATRYLINDACVLMDKPLVFGAVSTYQGQVAVFNHKTGDGDYSVNYRDLFPVPPSENSVLNCAEAGVLGPLPGMIGNMQAMEVIKLLSGVGEPLINKLLTYDALRQQMFTIKLTRSTDDYAPKNLEAFLSFDYIQACSSMDIPEMEFSEFNEDASGFVVVDVRDLNEMPRLNKLLSCTYLEIPLESLENEMEQLKEKDILFICQTGKRSKKAVEWLLQIGHQQKVFSLKNGISGIKNSQNER